MQLKSSNCPFLNEDQLNALNRLMIFTVEQFISHRDLHALSQLSKISVKQIHLAYKYFVASFSALPRDSKEVFDKFLKTAFIVKFRCKPVDDLLLGGLLSGELVEIHGGTATGKTQLCLNSCANILLSSTDSPSDPATVRTFKILYVNINNSFCVERLVAILKGNGENIENSLKDICVVNCANVFDLLDVLYQVENSAKPHNFTSDASLGIKSMLVIDNFNVLFTILRNNTTDYLSYLHYACKRLKYLAIHLNLVVLLTNVYEQNTDKMSLGPTWKSIPNIQIALRKDVDSSILLNLLKHNRKVLTQSNSSCKFKITPEGLS
jgi:hypothetical protein